MISHPITVKSKVFTTGYVALHDSAPESSSGLLPYPSGHTVSLAVFIIAYNMLPAQNLSNHCLLCLELSSCKQSHGLILYICQVYLQTLLYLESPSVVGRVL